MPYKGNVDAPKEEKVEEKPEPEVTASISVTETETDAEELSELEIE